MEIKVSVGEWMNSLQNRMNNAVEGDCFHLPTTMHIHAFTLLKEEFFPHKNFKFILSDTQNQTS
jgi:hypothetical protein